MIGVQRIWRPRCRYIAFLSMIALRRLRAYKIAHGHALCFGVGATYNVFGGVGGQACTCTA
jgi:hypothetical protein